MKQLIIFCIISFNVMITYGQDFWQQSNGPFAANILDIFIPNSDTVYISTYFDGIYNSYDNGETWNLVSDNLPQREYALHILVNNRDYIFAATVAHALFRSTDNGNTWDWLTNYGSGMTNTLLSPGVDTLDACTQDGLFESTDDGDFWYSLTANLSSGWLSTFTRNSQRRIFIGSSNGVIYLSDNEGISWDSIKICDNSIYTISVYGNSVFAGSDEAIYRSLDNGENWELVYYTLLPEEFFTIKQNSFGNIFALSTNAFYRSTDDGNSWQIINHEANSLYVLAIDSNNDIYAGSEHGGRGMYKSTDNGSTWQNKNEGIKNSFVLSITRALTGFLWAGTGGQGLYYSNNDGLNWDYSDFVNNNVNSIICSGNDDIFVATSHGFYLSQNAGQSWNEKDSGLSYFGINAMGLIDSCIYIGIYGSGVFKSCNQGDFWSDINYNLPDRTVTALAEFNNSILCGVYQGIYRLYESNDIWEEIFSVTSPQTIYVDENNNIFVGTGEDGAYISTDSGTTWGDLASNGLNAGDIRTFGTDLAGNIYAGTAYLGIYVSSDSGNNWVLLNEGLHHKTVNSFAVNSDGFIFAGTLGGGIYKSIEAITSVPTNKILSLGGYSLSQNFPNPFNPVTNISYTIKEQGLVKIKVYDILGKEVTTLVNEEKSEGNYSISFNGSNIPSGVYFYRI